MDPVATLIDVASHSSAIFSFNELLRINVSELLWIAASLLSVQLAIEILFQVRLVKEVLPFGWWPNKDFYQYATICHFQSWGPIWWQIAHVPVILDDALFPIFRCQSFFRVEDLGRQLFCCVTLSRPLALILPL